MLYVNDELVKPGTPAHDKFMKFKEKILPSLPDPVIFKSGKPIIFNENGLPEPPTWSWIPFDHDIMGDEGGEHWRYCNRPPRKNKDGNFKYSPRGKHLKRYWEFDKKRDTEQIFFFHQISPFIKNGKIICEDKERDAKRTLERETADLDVRFMITSDHSPISVKQTGSEAVLRMMAAAWGVADVHTDKLSIAEVQVELLSAVQQSHKNYAATQRGYNEFLEEVEGQRHVSTLANVQKAIDTGVIIYDKPTFSWRFVSTNTPIATIPARDAHDPKGALNKFLSLNDKSAKILELAIDDAYTSGEKVHKEPEDDMSSEKLQVVDEEEDMTLEKLQSMGWNDLRNLAREVGVQVHGKKRDEIENEMIATTV
jgi:hypothetical protein